MTDTTIADPAPDLASVVGIAERLAVAETRLHEWEAELRSMRRFLPSATPRQLETTCRDNAVLELHLDATFRMHCDDGKAVRARGETMDDVLDVLIHDQRLRFEEAGTRLLALRTGTRALFDDIGIAVHRMRGEPIADRLARILPGGDREVGLADAIALVAEDHEAVERARTTWRTVRGNRTGVLVIVESTPDAEVRAALRRMVADGRLRVRLTLRGRRWSRRSDVRPATRAARRRRG